MQLVGNGVPTQRVLLGHLASEGVCDQSMRYSFAGPYRGPIGTIFYFGAPIPNATAPVTLADTRATRDTSRTDTPAMPMTPRTLF